jgi:chemotaxis protein MotB
MRLHYRPRGAAHPAPAQHRWMVSYLDVLTILLILFVAVAAHAIQPAATPAPVPPPVVAPPAPVVAAVPEPEPDSVPNPVDEALATQGLAERGFDLHREPSGLVIGLPQTLLFPPGDERIPPAALPAIAEVAAVLRTIPNRVNLAGNADSVPIHNRHFHNNWELSAARGMALLDVLAGTYGIEESRLSVTSFGSYRPRAPNDSAESRAGNRRVEITILDAQE